MLRSREFDPHPATAMNATLAPVELPNIRTQQLPTGIAGLDRLLRGGLRRAGLYVLIGRAGMGKSIVAHQFGAHHIREGGTVLYLTALVETHQTLIAQARTFDFFDASTIANEFYYASLHPALERGGLGAMSEEIGRLVRERAPSLLIIDGLHALKQTADSKLDFQRWLHELEAQAAVAGRTTLLLTHPHSKRADDPTLTIADGIIELKTVPQELRRVRLLSVAKLRGVAHIEGWHTMRIARGGVQVYPRVEALVAAEGLPESVPPIARYGFAADGLGAMMGGGVTSSSTTFVIGTPGSGKTFLGLAFLCGGLEEGERALHFGFHETPDRLLMKADGIGLPLRRAVDEGRVQLHWQPPAELLSDEVAERILTLVDETGARRVVLDGYDQFKQGTITGARSQEFFAAFCNLLRARGVAAIFTKDMTRIAGDAFELPIDTVSQIIDNIIHVRSTEIHAEFKRLIAVLKVREQSYDRTIREFSIGPDGVRVGDVFREGEALLTGLPRLPNATPR